MSLKSSNFYGASDIKLFYLSLKYEDRAITAPLEQGPAKLATFKLMLK